MPFLVLQKRGLVALLLLSFGCLVVVNILWLFLTVLWVGLQCVIVVFPDHTHLLFVVNYKRKYVHEVLVNRLVKLAQEKSVIRSIDHLEIAII